MKFKVFEDSHSLVEYAQKFLAERLTSLQKDVRECLKSDCAFPALLYCFSNIDLLGALYYGCASEGSKSKGNFKEYMIKFMKNNSTGLRKAYTNEQADLFLDIYRHKVVHLAQPKLVVENNGRLIGWRYEPSSTSKHLTLEMGLKILITNILTPMPIFYDHIFVISIPQLVNDIVDSVTRPDGYLRKLQSGYKLMQPCFDEAIYQIYDIHESEK